MFPRSIVTLMKTMGPNKGVFKVDPKMTKLEVKEYLTTGKIEALEKEKSNPINIFTDI